MQVRYSGKGGAQFGGQAGLKRPFDPAAAADRRTFADHASFGRRGRRLKLPGEVRLQGHPSEGGSKQQQGWRHSDGAATLEQAGGVHQYEGRRRRKCAGRMSRSHAGGSQQKQGCGNGGSLQRQWVGSAIPRQRRRSGSTRPVAGEAQACGPSVSGSLSKVA
ncbi:hypothetical protein ACQJBY_055647 [Aegilops geniculata]